MSSSTKYIPPINFGYIEEDFYRSGQPNALNFPFLAKLNLKKIIYLAPDAPSQQFSNFVQDQEIDLVHLGRVSKGISPYGITQIELEEEEENEEDNEEDGQGSDGEVDDDVETDGKSNEKEAKEKKKSKTTKKRTNSKLNYTASLRLQQQEAYATGYNLGLITEEQVIAALEMILNPDNYPLAVMCNLGRHRTGTVIGCLRKLQNWNLTSILEEYRRYAGSKVRVQNEQFIELFDTDLVNIPQYAPKWL